MKMWSSVAQIPQETVVIPVLSVTELVTLGAEVTETDYVEPIRIIGQNEISHPGALVGTLHSTML